MLRFTTKAALAGVATAALYAGSASAQSLDLNYFWEYSGSGGSITNHLNFISTSDSFTAQLFAETVGANNFQNATGNLLPGGGSTASYFDGGPQNPILVGDVNGNGVARIDSVVDATWISDWPNDVFPVGTPNAPIVAGQFTVGNAVDGQYTIRINNAVGPALEINGVIVDGRFSQSVRGDANLDGDVDVFQFDGGGDIQIVVDNLGSTGVSLLQGDVSGDGDVDVFQFDGNGDIQIVVDNLGTTSAENRANEATATYNRDTGELTFNVGSAVSVLGVQSFSGDFITGAAPADVDGSAVAQFDANVLAYFDTNGLGPGSYNVGAVLAPGLTEADLGFSFTPLGGQSDNTTSVIIVPEPGSLALLGLGGLALIRRRRTAVA